MSTLLLENVIIVDGTGAPPYRGSVWIDTGKIRSVCPAGTPEPDPAVADRTMDGNGMMLCPGFIDAHSHSDLALLAAPEAFGKLSQGITTEVNGNCGLSPFPVTARNRAHLEELYAGYGVPLSWHSYAEYAAVLQQAAPAINVLSLCGHNTLRAAVLGYGRAPLTAAAGDAMQSLLYRALVEGAAGFSSGLIYIPGKFAPPEELEGLLRVLRPFRRPYTTHLRSEGVQLLEALTEAITVSQRAGIPHLHLSHLKTAGAANWHKLDAALELIAEGKASGLHITADRYPYIESMTNLSVILPPPYDDIDDVTLMRRLADPAEPERLEAALAAIAPTRWDTVRLVTAAPGKYHALQGFTFREIAASTGLTPSRICRELLVEDTPGTMAAFRGMNPVNLRRILAWPDVCCGTDETARPRDYRLGRSHPRGFGSFPEFYRLLQPSLSPEQIIYKMTGLPAAIFGLPDRGIIAPGYAADLVLLDPAALSGPADFAAPHTPARGIGAVFVNGETAYSDGRVIARAGQVLSPQI
ncbi:MAG: amidohydrolase family protein [Victivallales bacterium]|nr:amidohydrolase family protein [Victivallales bacterium]